MNNHFVVRSFIGTAFLLAATSLAFAQHGGGHGGGHGGHGGRHGGGHIGGHGGRHGGGHIGGHGGRHGGGHIGGHGGRHGGGHIGGHGGRHGGGHIGGHGGRHGGGHIGGHGGWHGGGHIGGHGGFGHYTHHWYPHFGLSIAPFYRGYGFSSYYSPNYYSGPYTTGYRAVGGQTVEAASAAPILTEPVGANATQQVATRPVTTPEGEAYQRKAEAAFRAGDFQRAARMANHALVEMPEHGKLLLFAAQTLFAVGDYRNASAVIHQAASLLNPEQWGYVVENYRKYYSGRAYVGQMDRLSEYIKRNPDADYAHFLRGYQHGFLGHQQTALRALNKAVELESRDKLAALLIERFGGTPPVASDQPDIESSPAAAPHPGPTALDNVDEQLPKPTQGE